MSGATPNLLVRVPEEAIDFMRASVDLGNPADSTGPYYIFDQAIWAALNPDRGRITKTSGYNDVDNSGASAQITFQSVDYNVGGLVNLSNNGFTIQTPGVYRVSAAVLFENSASNNITQSEVFLQINGTNVAWDRRHHPANDSVIDNIHHYTHSINYEAALGNGDVISLYGRKDFGGQILGGSGLNPWFTCSRLNGDAAWDL